MEKKRVEDSKKEELKYNKEFKRKVKDIIKKGITEDTLLEFYMVSCWYGKKYGNVVTTHDIKRMCKEVFEEIGKK
jgi:hypothetical protein